MSKERELLERVAKKWDSGAFYCSELNKDIHDCLASEKQDQPEGNCSDHPDAPHGFDRNASHNEGRYVCECEGWIPEKQDQPEPVASRLADELQYAQEIIFEGCGYKLISPEDADEIVAELRRLHPAPQRSFVRLSEEQVNSLMNRSLASYELICAVENRLVEKNR